MCLIPLADIPQVFHNAIHEAAFCLADIDLTAFAAFQSIYQVGAFA